MARGPAPAPTALKLVKGERKDRLPKDEPIPSETPITPPAWLSSPARTVWKRLAPDLTRKGVLKSWDVEEFAVWCDAVACHAQAAKLVAKNGVLVKGKDGNRVRNPATIVVAKYAQIVATIGARFGLTPSDRSRLTAPGKTHEEEDLL